MDVKTGNSMEGVRVHISSATAFFSSPFNEWCTTNKTGYYSVMLPRGYYRIVVISDDPETPGLDYIPVLLELDVSKLSPAQSEITVDFELYRGASIIVKGSLEFIEAKKVPDAITYSFKALDLRFHNLDLKGLISFYHPSIWSILGLELGHIVVPSDTPVIVSVSEWFMYGFGSSTIEFNDDNDSSFYKFPQGSRTIVDISKAVMCRNAAVVKDKLTSTWLQVEKLSTNGLNVKSEMDDLATAFNLLDSVKLALGGCQCYECFLNLKAAYIMNGDVRSRTSNMLADAIISPIPLTFLLSLSGFGLAGLLIEKEEARIVAGVFAALVLLGFYYYVSPGWGLTDPLLLLASCTMAAITAIGLAVLFPKLKWDIATPTGVGFVSSLTSTLSLATRNLKRRRLRSSLVFASILMLTFGFTALTTLQLKIDVISRRMMPPHPKPQPPEGLMVVAPSGPDYVLSPFMVEALKADPSVSSVAPKTETSPKTPNEPNPPIAQLISESGYNITIKGAIGVSSDEVKMSYLDEAVIKGTYVMEAEEASARAILISAKAADRLHVALGDRVKFAVDLVMENYTVAGILDDQMFEGIVDLDGQPIRPYVYTLKNEKVYLSPDELVVFNWRELLRLQMGRLSRINVQTKSGNDTMPIAFQLAKKWHCFVYASANNVVWIYLYSHEYDLSGGAAIPMVMVLVGLNVLACTMNAVYERKKEIAILSMVGVNPSQVCYIFLMEAGLLAFVGGAIGYLLGLGVPRLMFSLWGMGCLTEKASWTWGVAVILMAVVVSISASVIPAMKASTIATPKLPLKWKLEHLPATEDMWQLHMPQLVSKLEIERFIEFFRGKIEEMRLFQKPSERMELKGIMDEHDELGDAKKLLFTYGWAMGGTRAFETEDELVVMRRRGSSTYEMNLGIRITMVYNCEPMEVARRAASAIRKLMLQWTTTPSAERWGPTEELVRIGDLRITLRGKAVLSGIDLDVMKGEILGVAGEGRRELLLAIAGMLKPSGGKVQFLGVDMYSRRDEIKKAVAILLKGTELYEGFTVRYNLKFLAKLEEVREMRKAVDDILEICDMKGRADEMVSSLSPGDRRKLTIAQTLISKSSLLLLEDPFEGLKESEAQDIMAFLIKLNKEGITIVYTSKGTDELDFCNRIMVLKGEAVTSKVK